MRHKQHHTWLFGFTDLAFLLLISLSLLPSAPEQPVIHLSYMDVPVVPSNPNLSPLPRSEGIWELIVGKDPDNANQPFTFAHMDSSRNGSEKIYSNAMGRDELVSELQLLKKRGIRPVLIPSTTSLSHDFLFAAGAIAKTWESHKSKTIVKSLTPDEGYQE